MIGCHRYRLVETWANKPAVRLVGLGRDSLKDKKSIDRLHLVKCETTGLGIKLPWAVRQLPSLHQRFPHAPRDL
jgi:hypothetical protein